MSAAKCTTGRRDNVNETKRPALRPPLVVPFPPGFRPYAEGDDTPRGDQSIVLDKEDERILDGVWAEVAHYPKSGDSAPNTQPSQPVEAAAGKPTGAVSGGPRSAKARPRARPTA